MARISSKPSMKNALQGSLQSEQQSFAARLAKADEKFGDNQSQEAVAEVPVKLAEPDPEAEIVSVPTPAPVTKVVREAFTIPEPEHKQIDALRAKLLGNAVAATKSEIVRAGLLMLSEVDDRTLVEIVGRLERVKTGRPKGI